MTPIFAEIKKPSVSGQFYPSNAKELSAAVDDYVAKAGEVPQSQKVRMVISPHAGYMFSGWVAAYGYKAASAYEYSTVVLVGPSHYVDFQGISIWPTGGFETPLGVLKVDEDLASKLMASEPSIKFNKEAYQREHSLEVQFPFIQKLFPKAKVVTLLMGRPDPRVCHSLADALNKLVGGREDVLVVISTDLSHYHADDAARVMDDKTLKALSSDAEVIWNGCITGDMEMCGFTAVVSGLLYAQANGLRPQILKYANSSEVTGDKERVVGYSSVIFTKADAPSGMPPLTKEQKKQLIDIAKQTVHEYVRNKKIPNFEVSDPRLNQAEGAFVTIEKDHQLRGCIGHIIADGPLYKTVRDMAVAAASEDPRFPPVTPEELAEIEIEVSVLSKPRQVADAGAIVLGKHGVILSQGPFRKGVFLPQVATETGWSKEEFLSNLSAHKAGLPADAWKDPRTKLEVFEADVFSEHDL